MKSKVAVYNSHEKAVKAVEALIKNGIPAKHISLIGKIEENENNLEHIKKQKIEKATAYLGVGAGTLAGLLTGLGVFTIPGFGFLYGAGAIIGAIGGFDLGVIAGGILALLEEVGINKDKLEDYENRLNNGEFFVIVKGSEEEAEKAEEILGTEGTHLILE